MKNIALVYGGFSKEAEISEKSAYQAKNALAKSAYTIFPIFISKEKWVYKNDSGTEFPVDKNDFSILVDGKKINFDKALNLIHGAPGENGVLGSYFSLIGLPYTSSGVLTSALTMNKNWTTRFLKESGIVVPLSFVVYRGDDSAEYLAKAKYPCFVKPNNGGSSIGTSKVKQEEELSAAIEKAFKEDRQVIVESFLDGTEVTCGVIQWQGKVMALPMTEIVTQNEFFDFATFNSAPYSKKNLVVSVSGHLKTVQKNNRLILVVSSQLKDGSTGRYLYYSFETVYQGQLINDDFLHNFVIENVEPKETEFKVYLWNRNLHPTQISNISTTIYQLKK